MVDVGDGNTIVSPRVIINELESGELLSDFVVERRNDVDACVGVAIISDKAANCGLGTDVECSRCII